MPGEFFTLPKALRVFFRHDQRLFAKVPRLIFCLIAEFCSAAAGNPIVTAAVIAYQPFGDSLRFNPQFHALILEGGFDPAGKFYYLPIHDTARLAECLRRRTIGLFLGLGLITQQFVENLLCWRHSGFSVDNSVRLDGGDHHARQALAQYIARAPLSMQKLTYDQTRRKGPLPHRLQPLLQAEHQSVERPGFHRQMTQFIPPWGVRYVHYYGLYSSRCKARWQHWPMSRGSP